MIANPLGMNDWEIKKFLLVISVVQLVLLGLLGLSALGFDIPVLRQIAGFIYLAFIPGIIILRILRLHELGWVRTLLYSVGLSLAFDMFLGFLINVLYPYIGISRPISTLPLIITWTVVLGILSFIAYKRDKDYAESVGTNAGTLLSPPALLLYLLPPVSVLGSCLLNSQQTSAIPVQLFLLGLVAVVVALLAFGKFIPRELYPLAVFSIALSLLLHYSLATFDLQGRDARFEYYLYSLVAANGVWNSATPPDFYNAMLSVSILPTIFSCVLNLDGRWIFNIVWAIFYALIPLGLYDVYKRQIGDKNAFLAAFYLITVSVFYANITALPRQEIGMFFLALMILVLVDKTVSLLNRRVLLITFAFALIVSHYSVSYIFIFLCLAALPLLLFFPKAKHGMMTPTFVSLFVASALGWYLYNAQASVFSRLVNTGWHLATSFYNELLNVQSREVSFIVTTGQPGPLRYIHLSLLLLMSFFIGIGILKLIIDHPRKTIHEEYSIFSLLSFSIMAACIVVPFLSDTMGLERLYVITLLFLAPFCVSGGELVLGLAWKVLKLGWGRAYLKLQKVLTKTIDLMTLPSTGRSRGNLSDYSNQSQIWYGIVAFLLIALFLFASNFVYVVVAPDRPPVTHSFEVSGGHLGALFSPAEDSAGLWLLDRMDSHSQVWSDDSGWCLFIAYRGYEFGQRFYLDEKPPPDNAYIYLRKFNIRHGVVIVLTGAPLEWKRQAKEVNIDDIVSLDNRNKIYFSGSAVIYKDGKKAF